ncbi:Daunorubicin/doxorubicin resistance ATP-binding protein drrA [Nostocoides japonicum T1-X7]|uniref:Daunorubicin/doxorubicin resistance ATP-binding protein drrA n=1 Tax=Nostocoides japonicum T1-X7 TaxID=1194083 RepID=A0A077M1X0_9MICO|nr:ATP-binding cassette domain-containing protein [Tetrasphaera japonica]CCH80333.1 Daunorubicin/doxorubicin resistance ATP-binding protein drrA [Tetrasphaera japonica T1-X7]
MTKTSTSHELAVHATGLVKHFKDVRAVDGIDLDVTRGSIFGLLGPNGAGKTTVVRMLATLLSITDGHAEIFGLDVARQPHQVRQLIGVTGQYASVDEKLTARENLRLFARILGQSGGQAKATADDLLERFALEEAANRPLANFSGGMRRRLDLAASLISRPPLVFLDEPTTGLDPRTRGQMWDTIRELVEGGATILLTTQYLDEADQLADRIAVVDRGTKVAEGTSNELKAMVGDASLQLTLLDPDEADEAARIVDRVTGSVAQDTRAAHGTAHLTVPMANADDAGDVLVALRHADIGLAAISVAQPTLDEVFLALTGRPAEPQSGLDDAADEFHDELQMEASR